ncbi:hypothetical protein FACS1894164_19590 [Spirochaetia bacterium]|nr:hypothetical protein FACS1894164_19590 [Spirochaetia bacterium]
MSLHVLDMREIYRKIAFEPGDCLSVSVRDWKKGRFDLQMVKRGTWQESALEEWRQTAESGFRRSFDELGPSSSTEEQITFAYWYGGRRMLELPAYSLEDFLYEKTNYIETVPYGLESRFWYAGREIPDQIEPAEEFITDSHPAEEILYRYKVPVSRFVIQAYIRDAFFRDDRNLMHLIERIAPAAVGLERYDIQVLMSFLTELIIEMHEHYIPFVDQKMGHFRQRIAELHTAIIELTAHLRHSSIEAFQLPHHTFITLSQLQEHTAGMLEDLDTDECPPDSELMILDVSIENMLDTYRDVRESIEESIDGFRWSTFSFESADSDYGYIIQTGIVGTEVWRQLSFPKTGSLTLMHECIQAVFRWNNQFPHRFVMVEHGEDLPEAAYIQEIVNKGIRECAYEYGLGWTLKIVIVSRLESGESIQCVAGNGAAPPEQSGGALHFQKLLEDLGRIEPFARERAAAKLGPDFNPVFFDVEQCNQDLLKIFGK